MPPDSLWVEPVGTWEGILAGHVSPDGKYISVSTAIRLIAKAVIVGHAAAEWNGSEGGTARVIDDGKTSDWPSSEYPYPYEAESDRAERIASEIADRKLDQQHDNEN